MKKWAFVDLETTGGSFATERIIEIGIVIMEDGIVTQVYKTMVNPEKMVSPFILQLTGIDEQDLWTAPHFSDILLTVYDLLKDALFIAHNASFDKGFLRAEFARCGITWDPPTLCTVRLSRRLFPGYRRHNLDEIMRRFSIECSARHRALGDAQVLVEFWKILLQRFPTDELDRAVKDVCGKPHLPRPQRQALLKWRDERDSNPRPLP